MDGDDGIYNQPKNIIKGKRKRKTHYLRLCLFLNPKFWIINLNLQIRDGKTQIWTNDPTRSEKEAGFELHEEECEDDRENEKTYRPHQWLYIVNDVCNEVHVRDDGSDGVRSESDLKSLCSDEEEQATRRSKKEYNWCRNPVDFKFELGIEFPLLSI